MSKGDMYTDRIMDVRVRVEASIHVADGVLDKIRLIQVLTNHLHNEYEERRSPDDFSHRKAVLIAHWEAVHELLSSLEKSDVPVKKALDMFKKERS